MGDTDAQYTSFVKIGFRCPRVQNCMKTSNYTRLAYPVYAGMIKTMKAIDECFSQHICDFENRKITDDNDRSNSITIFFGAGFKGTKYYNQQGQIAKNPYENITLPISESDCTSNNGTFYIFNLIEDWYLDDEDIGKRLLTLYTFDDTKRQDDFLKWRATTNYVIPKILEICSWSSMIFAHFGCMMLVFSIQFQKDDPIEIIYPPLLEAKDTGLGNNRAAVEADVENATITSVSEESNYTFHFVRPKELVLQAGLLTTVLLVPLFSYLMQLFWGNTIGFGLAIFYGIFIALSISPILSNMITGLVTQVHNATTLANILVQICTTENMSSEQIRIQFEKWKLYYKNSVGALHIWSSRMTPIFGTMLIGFAFSIVYNLTVVIFMYTAVTTDIGIEESLRFDRFTKVASIVAGQLLSFTVGLLIVVGAMALVSVKYTRLRLLVATLRLPKHRLDDFEILQKQFEILQKQNAALTIFDFPITTKTVISILRLLFVQTALYIYSWISSHD